MSTVPTDIEIAQAAKLRPIAEVAAEIGLGPDEILPYGRYKAKITPESIARRSPKGRLVLVSGINPTPAGEGKTTTTIGLIQAFQAVGAANPSDKADLLSASISVAMNTTAFGLIVAIPLLLVHSVIQSKTTQLIDSLEMASVKFLNSITERSAAAAQQG